jgi:lysophospholipase L1-like esterase
MLIICVTISFLASIDYFKRLLDAYRGDYPDKFLSDLMTGKNHAVMHYTSYPNMKGNWTFGDGTYWTEINSFGFRSREFFPRSPDRFRVLVMGDSFVFGYNASQEQTLGSQIEAQLRQMDPRAEVLSMGVASYSGVVYAAGARLYMDFLQPDIVIVALDHSDYHDDLARSKIYDFDQNGCPTHLKAAEEAGQVVNKTQDGKMSMHTAGQVSRTLAFKMVSPIYNFIQTRTEAFQLAHRKEAVTVSVEELAKRPPVTYESLVERGKDDISGLLPTAIANNMIPYSRERARTIYKTTKNAIACVKRHADKAGARTFVLSYPYPWEVNTTDTLEYLSKQDGVSAALDMRGNRLNPELAKEFADAAGAQHINAYPYFEGPARGMYGVRDPHFSPEGYGVLAKAVVDRVGPVYKSWLAGHGGVGQHAAAASH